LRAFTTSVARVAHAAASGSGGTNESVVTSSGASVTAESVVTSAPPSVTEASAGAARTDQSSEHALRRAAVTARLPARTARARA
jgi:hypothetical protein